jgi:hypothetical protein
MQDRINNNSSSTRKTEELCPLDDLKAKDAAAARKQTSPILLIPNQPLSRQGKSLDYVLAYYVDITVESCIISQFSEKSHLSGTGKLPDFQVTSCHHFVSTNVVFAYIKSEYMSFFTKIQTFLKILYV